jgi:hypothetical protein
MDTQTILVGGGVGTTFSVILYILFRCQYKKRCHSNCIKDDVEMNFDIENTTPVSRRDGPENKTDSIREQTTRQETSKDEA